MYIIGTSNSGILNVNSEYMQLCRSNGLSLSATPYRPPKMCFLRANKMRWSHFLLRNLLSVMWSTSNSKQNQLSKYQISKFVTQKIIRKTPKKKKNKISKTKNKTKNNLIFAYVMSSVLKFETIELMKFSRIITARIDFQSDAFSPSSKHIDSNANLTIAGGLAIERTSTRCCFLIDFTARNLLIIHCRCEHWFGIPLYKTTKKYLVIWLRWAVVE